MLTVLSFQAIHTNTGSDFCLLSLKALGSIFIIHGAVKIAIIVLYLIKYGSYKHVAALQPCIHRSAVFLQNFNWLAFNECLHNGRNGVSLSVAMAFYNVHEATPCHHLIATSS